MPVSLFKLPEQVKGSANCPGVILITVPKIGWGWGFARDKAQIKGTGSTVTRSSVKY